MERIIRENRNVESVVVANGAQVSTPINKEDFAAVGIGFPAALEGTSIGWQVSNDDDPDGTWFDYYEDDAIYAETIADGAAVTSPAALCCWPFIRVKIGTAQTGELALVVVKGS